MTPDEESTGTTLAGRWRLEAPLSSEGRAEVWRATDLRLHRQVAVKLLLQDAHDRDTVKEVRRKTELAARVQHPNVMRLYDTVEDDGRLLLVCELIDGPRLDQVLERGGRLAPRQVAAVGLQLADGLVALHARDIVHRQLRPSNVMVARDGTVKIIGFGSAKWLRSESTLTDQSQLLEAVDHLAPEQLRAGLIDHRVDIYGLGLTCWELAVGRQAFHRQLAVSDDEIDTEPPPVRSVVRGLPAELAAVIDRCVAADPDDRYDRAADVAAALASLVQGRPSAATQSLADL